MPHTMDSWEGQLVQEINRLRVQAGLSKLSGVDKLNTCAEKEAQCCAAAENLDEHECGGTLGKRFGDVGYEFSWAGECLSTYPSPKEVADNWSVHPGHREILYSSLPSEIGAGVAQDAAGTHYSCCDFGQPFTGKDSFKSSSMTIARESR